MQLALWAPLVVAAGLLAAGSLAMMLLPEMALRPLEDTVEDAAERNSRDGSSFAGSLAGNTALREISLQGMAAAVVEGLKRHRTSSMSGVGSGGGTSAAAAGSEEYLADSPRSLKSHRRRSGYSSSAGLNPEHNSASARLSGSDSSSYVRAGSGGGRALRGLEMAEVNNDAAAAAEEGRSLLLSAEGYPLQQTSPGL
jgi:hypothetical protein